MYPFNIANTSNLSSLEKFRLLHSEIIEEYQCIEYDMRRIYSSMLNEDFEESMDELWDKNWGVILNKLKKLDKIDGNPYFSKEEYDLLDEIRTRRNYWCHQCYLDFVYEDNSYEYEILLQKKIHQVENELNRAKKLQRKMEKIYLEDFS